jgi:hypothetical protein
MMCSPMRGKGRAFAALIEEQEVARQAFQPADLLPAVYARL